MNACSLSPQPTSECIVLCNSKNTGPAFSSNSKTQFRTQASTKIQIAAYNLIVCVTPAFYAMLMQWSQDLHINGGHTRVALNLWLQISRKFWPRERTTGISPTLPPHKRWANSRKFWNPSLPLQWYRKKGENPFAFNVNKIYHYSFQFLDTLCMLQHGKDGAQQKVSIGA